MSLRLVLASALATLGVSASAQVFTRSVPIDFYRDATSRGLVGLAARADGRLVDAPFLQDLKGPALPPLLWAVSARDDKRLWLGSGPNGKLLAVTIDAAAKAYSIDATVDLPISQVYAVLALADGSALAAGAGGNVFWVKDGRIGHRLALPVEAVHALVPVPGQPDSVLIGTGGPGRIYKLDTRRLASAPADAKTSPDLAALGVVQLGEVRDRHLRTLAVKGEAVIAGSSPKGNLYSIPLAGGSPTLLVENRDTEVTSLRVLENGDLLATFVQAANDADQRQPNRGGEGRENAGGPTPQPRPPATPYDRFGGRSSLARIASRGGVEVLTQRNNLSFYATALRGRTVVLGTGEQGELLGYDLDARLSLLLPGTASAQVNGFASLGSDRLLLIRNNPAGMSLLAPDTTLPRSVETRRLDLGSIAKVGAFRPLRIRGFDEAATGVSLRLSRTTDETEGWGPWTKLEKKEDGWTGSELVGRHAKIKLTVPASPGGLIDKAELFYEAENRRPQVTEFRFLPPNWEVRVSPDSLPSVTTTVSALLVTKKPERDNGLGSAQAVPKPGVQVATWTLADPDGDSLAANFDIKAEGSDTWIPLAVDSKEQYVQFATEPFAEGYYTTRLTVKEQAPRAEADRLTTSLEVDTLTIDRTGPAILDVSANRDGESWVVSVDARDALSILDRAEFTFNTGYAEKVGQPDDGLRDSRRERFTLRAPLSLVGSATSVEVTVYDAIGNPTYARVALAP